MRASGRLFSALAHTPLSALPHPALRAALSRKERAGPYLDLASTI